MKIWLKTAAALVAAGGILFVGMMGVMGWDFMRLGVTKYTTNTYEIEQPFDNIVVMSDAASVVLKLSADDSCRVVCEEATARLHTVLAENGTLSISVPDKPWYQYLLLDFKTPHITVYLPKAAYASLAVKGNTGDVQLESGLVIDTVDVSIITGNIKMEHLEAETVRLSVTTGEVSLSDVTCHSLDTDGTKGGISLTDTVAAAYMRISRTTGWVWFDGCDAASLSVKVTTGSVRGSLLTEKVFSAHATTGNVSVPDTKSGGTCEITTTTGNIEMWLQ